MSQSVKANQFVVGIYDNSRQITKTLAEALGPDKILGYTDSDSTHIDFPSTINIDFESSTGSITHHSSKRSFFFACCHIIIKVDSLSSLSFFTGALKALINSDIKSLMVITDLDVKPLINMGEEWEKSRLIELESIGLFSIRPDFSLTTFLRLIQTIG